MAAENAAVLDDIQQPDSQPAPIGNFLVEDDLHRLHIMHKIMNMTMGRLMWSWQAGKIKLRGACAAMV